MAATSETAPNTAINHYSALRTYLESYLQKEQQANGISPARQSAREKLKKLHSNQFEELSTDVYDEMNRRISDESVGFLPVQRDFHPKRNQARQKLATLSSNRFKDLASDVYSELDRRYPELAKSLDKSADLEYGTDGDDGELTEPSAMVNFQSLDNLMADLGNMIATSIDETPAPPYSATVEVSAPPEKEKSIDREQPQQSKQAKEQPAFAMMKTASVASKLSNNTDNMEESFNIAKLQDEVARYKGEVQVLKNQIDSLNQEVSASARAKDSLQADYERQTMDMRNEIQVLKNNVLLIERKDAEISELNARLTQTEADRNVFKDKYQSIESEIQQLREDLQSEQRFSNSYKSEITNLQQELADQQTKNRKQQEEYEAKISQLSDSLARSHAHTEEMSRSLESNKTNIVQPVAPLSQVPSFDETFVQALNIEHTSPDGAVTAADVTALKEAVYELLKAAKDETPAGVLIAMKTIVVSTRSISEASEAFENSLDGSVSNQSIQKANKLREQVSRHLTQLMTAAKNHATGSQNSVGSLNDASFELVSDIVELISIIKVQSPVKKVDDEPYYSIEQLKIFLEQKTDLIVQNIQTLLLSMKQQSFGGDFRDTIQNIKTVVDNLISVCRKSVEESRMPEEHQTRGKLILKQLGESNQKLDELGNGMLNSSQKPSKQKLAAAAYEVAKFTKELVSLFDAENL